MYNGDKCTLAPMDMNHENALREQKVGLTQAAVEALRDYGFQTELDTKKATLGTTEADGVLRLRRGELDTLYVIEVKRGLNPTTLGHIAPKLNPATLLITDYVAPETAAKLKKLNIPFVDAAGNAWLQGRDFVIWVTGRKPTIRTRNPPIARAFQQGGLQLTFAILTNPNWIHLPYRALAERVGIANGTVGAAMGDLEKQGFLVRTKGRNEKRRLRNRRVLAEKWTEAYLQKLYPTTEIGRYRAENDLTDWWQDIQPEQYQVLLGAEPAAAKLTNFLTPGIVTLYVRRQPGPLILDKKLRADADGNVVLRRKFWKFEPEEWDHRDLVPPLLIYADLLATGDARCIETARKVYDGYLARSFDES